MYKRIRVKLYPTIKQKEVLDQHFEGFRYCYNLCLEYRTTLWQMRKMWVSAFDMGKEILKIRNDTPWLKNCKSESVRGAAFEVQNSLQNFFKGKGYPKFKSKKGIQSFPVYTYVFARKNKVEFYGNKIEFRTCKLYKEILESNKIKKATFKRDLCGDYWATCLIEVDPIRETTSPKGIIGLDLGLKDLLITSEGRFYENKKYLVNAQFRLRHLKRKFAKTKKGGSNREKLRVKLAKIHRKITNQKRHYYHQITNEIIRDNQTIVVETLKIRNMMKNHSISRNVCDVSWGLLTTMLEYKSIWHSRRFIKINTWFPSSKTCSGCGNAKEELSLRERIYKCDRCNLEIDRDINAAINIRNEGLKIPGLPVEDTHISAA